jgi:hydrogenase maturation protease
LGRCPGRGVKVFTLHKFPKILFYGYGNPGRQDDGLGNAFIEKVEKWCSDNGVINIDIDSNYQLNIEDAEIISHYDVVFFVDASIEENINDFLLTTVEKENKQYFTTHAASPATIAFLCGNLYNKNPEVFLIHIKGYEWELKEELTAKAKENLDKAFKFIESKYLNSLAGKC